MDSQKEMDTIIIQICEETASATDGILHTFSRETKMELENGIDSFVFMNIIIEIETYFGINMDDMLIELGNAKTIGELIDIIKRKE